MAFKRFMLNRNLAEATYYDFGDDSVKIVKPNEGAVVLTKESFTKLLTYFRGFDFMLARKEIGNNYNTRAKLPIGYFVEDEDGNLVVVGIEATKAGQFGDTIFSTIDSSTGKVAKKLSLTNQEMTKLVYLANLAGIKSDAKEYKDIVFVDQLPAETDAKRFTVYAFEGKYYTLNADESALVEITFETKKKLPASETLAKEGILYNLHNNQEIKDVTPPITFKPGIYTYTAATNSFTLQDLKIKKVDKLPAADKADTSLLYYMIADEKNSAGEVIHAKGTAWTFDGTKFTNETRKIMDVQTLPYVELAKDGTKYYVDNTVYAYAAATKKFTKIGVIVKVDELPNVSTTTVDEEVIYVLNKDDGTRRKSTRWVFDGKNKEFVEYVDPTEETPSPTPEPSPSPSPEP